MRDGTRSCGFSPNSNSIFSLFSFTSNTPPYNNWWFFTCYHTILLLIKRVPFLGVYQPFLEVYQDTLCCCFSQSITSDARYTRLLIVSLIYGNPLFNRRLFNTGFSTFKSSWRATSDNTSFCILLSISILLSVL